VCHPVDLAQRTFPEEMKTINKSIIFLNETTREALARNLKP
jgi:hypothetical protein